MNDIAVPWSCGLPQDLLAVLPHHLAKSIEAAPVRAWLFGEGRNAAPVKRYLAYLKLMGESFRASAEMFDLWSPSGSRGSKYSLRLTEPEEILYLANHLYILDSFGVKGTVLECGCAHGFSSACLSLACGWLGRSLCVADRFEGLPQTREGQEFFAQGDYAASEEEVLEHIRLFGRPEAVLTRKGWYSSSLKGWNEPIALLWMDVDLYESARDLLAHTFDCLDSRGAIFTHEYTDFSGVVHVPGSLTVPGAIHESFSRAGVTPREQLIARYWGMFGRPEALQFASARVLDELRPALADFDPRARRLAELRGSRTVKVAFAIKNMLMPPRSA